MSIYQMDLEKLNLLYLVDYLQCSTRTKNLDERYANIDLNHLEDQQYEQMLRELNKFINEKDMNTVQTVINDYISLTDNIHFVLGMKYMYKILH